MQNKFKIVPITHGSTIDMTGETYGRLTVLGLSDKKTRGGANWVCQCECGRKTIVLRYNLTSENTTSCGCYNREQVIKQTSKSNTTHGETGTRLYRIHDGMKQRCTNPNDKSYPRYGGRGIEVSAEWAEDYIAFANWARSNGYQDDLTIDRIDNDGNYEVSNCRWTTMREQSNNTRKNIMIEYNGETHTMSEWSRITGINRNTLSDRYNRGDRSDRLFRPVKKSSNEHY